MQRDLERGPALLILAGILLAGFAIRVMGIGDESAWWDEYSSLVHLREPGLLQFLSANRTYDPATLPLYYTIEYLWSCIMGTDTTIMRVPSLLLGLLIIPAVYALGATLHSRQAGLIAAACVALSPIHAFHAQGIRMYVLFTLLAVLSMWTWARLRQQSGRGQWLWHALVQFLLSWTHPFAVLVPAVQGLAWLLQPGEQRRGVWKWAVLVGLVWLPALLYVATIRYYPEDKVNWIRIPTMTEFAVDLVADDVVRMGYELYPSDRAFHYFGLPAASAIQRLRPLLDWALIALLAGGALLGIRRMPAGAAPRWLLPLWVLAPPVALYAASLAVRPMIAPRYTVHSSIGLYLLAAIGIASLPPRWRLAGVLLAGLMLFQTGLVHPGPQRTNYLGAASMVHAEGNPATDVAIVVSFFERRILEYNRGFSDFPLVHVEGSEPATVFADALIAAGAANAWIIYVVPYWNAGEAPDVLARKLGLSADMRNLPGIQGIQVARVSAAGPDTPQGERAATLDTLRQQFVQTENVDWLDGLMENAAKLEPRSDAAAAAACQLFQMYRPAYASLLCGPPQAALPPARAEALRQLMGIDSDAWFEESSAVTMNSVVALDPAFGLPRMITGLRQAVNNDLSAALPALEAACAADPQFASIFGAYTAAVRRGDLAAALAATAPADALGNDAADLLRGLAERLLAPAPEATP
jgi:mannosyltransferase